MSMRFLDDVERPLDDVAVTSNHLRLAESSGLHAGAENLLLKAIDALGATDEARAEALVRRAARLPFDDYEQMAPAWWQAYMLLFSSITDELEDGPGDDDWLTAALAVDDTAVEYGRAAVRLALAVIDADFPITHDQGRRIRSRIGERRARQDWQAMIPEGEDAVTAAILQVLAAFTAYDDALDDLADS